MAKTKSDSLDIAGDHIQPHAGHFFPPFVSSKSQSSKRHTCTHLHNKVSLLIHYPVQSFDRFEFRVVISLESNRLLLLHFHEYPYPLTLLLPHQHTRWLGNLSIMVFSL